MVTEHAERIRRTGRFSEIHTCFIRDEPPIEGALDRIEADRVFVVPVFISHGVHTTEDIPEALGLDSTGKDVTYCDPIGDDPVVTDVILKRTGQLLETSP